MSNYRANMAYVGAVPWHGLGEELTPGAPIETWLVEAGMDYSIERSRVAFRHTEGANGVTVMDDRNVLWRSDTKAPLAVVSNRYQIFQPRDVLEFFRDLLRDVGGDYEIETAGVLNDGKTYWALAKYCGDPLVFGNDVIKPYLLVSTACDGTMSNVFKHTSVRVVCNNTLQMSLHGNGEGVIKIPHSTKVNVESVKAQLNVDETIALYRADIGELINKTLSKKDSVELLVDVIAKRDSDDVISNEKHVKRVVDEIMISLANAPGAKLETANGTGWGLMNATTHYVDFKARARSDNNRFNSGQFGAGAKFKQEIFDAIIAA
jgi:phage/plasmid-like protein (TIGR03299 family)